MRSLLRVCLLGLLVALPMAVICRYLEGGHGLAPREGHRAPGHSAPIKRPRPRSGDVRAPLQVASRPAACSGERRPRLAARRNWLLSPASGRTIPPPASGPLALRPAVHLRC